MKRYFLRSQTPPLPEFAVRSENRLFLRLSKTPLPYVVKKAIFCVYQRPPSPDDSKKAIFTFSNTSFAIQGQATITGTVGSTKVFWDVFFKKENGWCRNEMTREYWMLGKPLSWAGPKPRENGIFALKWWGSGESSKKGHFRIKTCGGALKIRKKCNFCCTMAGGRSELEKSRFCFKMVGERWKFEKMSCLP